MSVGTEGVTALVVSGDQTRSRDLAAGLEAAADRVSAVTAVGLEDALDRLERTELDGVVLATAGLEEGGRAAVEAIADTTDAPVVVDTHGTDLTGSAALEAGATEVAANRSGATGSVVIANRLELAVGAARAEATVTETQRRYHQLLETAPAAIVITDAEGAIRYANQPAADVVGAEDAYEVVDRDIWEFVAEDARPAVREQFECVVADREPLDAREVALRDVDGERRYAEAAGSPVTVDGEPGCQAVLTDVTERKERERRLRTERDRFTTLFESLPEPAVHVRYRDGEPVVRNVNTAFVEG